MAERKFKLIPVVLGAALLAVVGLIAYELLVLNRALPPTPLPNPNGYDDFVKAAKIVTGVPGDYSTMNAEELHRLVATNNEALRLIHLGLSRRSRMPMAFSITNQQAHITVLAGLKTLAQLQTAEGRLAEEELRTNDAARVYLDEVRFAHECSRGGLVIDRLVGLACESIGTGALGQLAASVDAKTARDAARTLEQIERHREPPSATLKNEREWVRRNYSVVARLLEQVSSQVKRARMGFAAGAHFVELQSKHLMIDLAARAYELERGQRPKTANDLVPDYLDSIPTDPTTGTNLTYLPHPP